MKIDHSNNFGLIRIFAASQVLIMHAGSAALPSGISYVLSQFPGVPIFFIVSGFLVAWSYLYGKGGVWAYFSRRVLRIYPALWVNVSIILLLLFVSGSIAPNLTARNFAIWVATTFTAGSDIYGTYIAGNIVNPAGFYPKFPSGVLWTIPEELGFYLLLPLIVATLGRNRKYSWIVLLIWFAVSFSILRYYQHLKSIGLAESSVAKVISINPLTDLWLFLLGTGCAIYWNTAKLLFENRFLFWLPIFFAVSILEMIFFGTQFLDIRIGSPVSMLAIILMLIQAVLLAAVVLSFAFTWKTLASILRGNDFSYGIYLYHMPIAFTLIGFGLRDSRFYWLILVAGTVCLAAMSWYFIERPALRLKSRTANWLLKRDSNISRSAG